VHRACFSGNYEALWILIQYHADVSVQDNYGRAPIHWASIATTSDCLQVSRNDLGNLLVYKAVLFSLFSVTEL